MKARGPNNFKKREDIVRCKIVDLKTRDWRMDRGPFIGGRLPDQKENFNASWMTLGLEAVPPIVPAAPPGSKSVLGSAKTGWLKTLNTSALKLSCAPSVGHFIGITFERDMSLTNWLGPRILPIGAFPKAVAIPSSPITGGVVQQSVLK